MLDAKYCPFNESSVALYLIWPLPFISLNMSFYYLFVYMEIVEWGMHESGFANSKS